MAYTPTTWTTGDDVTATKLNKLEQGVANAGSVLIVTDTNGTLDKTFAEICDALDNGIPCFVKYYEELFDGEVVYRILAPVVQAYLYGSMYRVQATISTSEAVSTYSGAGTPALWTYSATSTQSYPTFLCMVRTYDTSVSAITAHHL